MKKIVLVLLTISSMGFAQIKYEPGYFITNDGKKTDCLIQNWAWRKNPTEFQYYFSEGEKPQTATIETVQEFNVNNSYKFKRYTVNLDESSSKLQNISSQKQPIWITKTLFLKVLVEGKANLYQYDMNDESKYFISTGNHEMAEQLVYKEYLQNGDIAKNNHFRQQLVNTLQSEKVPASDLKSLRYEKNALTDIIVKYNDSDGSQSTNFTTKQNKSKLNAKVTVGAGLASFNAEDIYGLTKYDGGGLSVRLGVEVEGILPFNNEKWALFVDPNFNFFKDSGTSGSYTIETKYNYFQLPLGLRHYMFLKQNSKIFLNAGIAFTLPLSSETTYTLSGNSSTTTELEKSTTGFAGIGYDANKFSLEMRFNLKQSLNSASTVFTIQHSLVSVVFGYKF